MVAELLGLKLRMLVNEFRGSARQVGGRLLWLALAIGVPLLVVAWLGLLVERRDGAFDDAVTVIGAALPVLSLAVPVLLPRRDPMHPRAFIPYGLRPTAVAGVLVLLAVIGLPTMVLGILLVGIARLWPEVGAPGGAAIVAALGLYLVCLLLTIVGTAIGGTSSRGRGRTIARVAAAVLLLVLAVRAVPVLFGDPRYFFGRLTELGASLADAPIAALPRHPALARDGIAAPDALVLLAAVLVAAALWFGWRLWIGRVMSGRSGRGLVSGRSSAGWLSFMPTSPTGAIAARSILYWLRDPRYRGSYALLPALPFLMVGAGWIGGVPTQQTVLAVLPAMVLVLAWATLHNDVAHDSTAIWMHLVADTRGGADRLGRLVPPLVLGAVLIAVGAPLSAALFADQRVTPALVGVCSALLLGAVGISSAVSARFPYPAPRPGDGAFDSPQTSGGNPGATQALTFFGSVLVAVPALLASWMWFTREGEWNLIALGVGLGMGLLVLLIGIRVGARAFERRGPELLAFTMQN